MQLGAAGLTTLFTLTAVCGALTSPGWPSTTRAHAPEPRAPRQPPEPPVPPEEPAAPSPEHPWLRELVETGQWNEDARRVLAQAVLGEAGPRRSPDWALIPWVLLRRWRDLRRNQPAKALTFAEMVRAYSCPVKPSLASKSRWRWARRRGDTQELRRIRRRRFFQALEFDSNVREVMDTHGVRDDGDLLASGWMAIASTIDQWSLGAVPNPCPRARHWDMKAAPKPGKTRVCTWLPTRNAFYR